MVFQGVQERPPKFLWILLLYLSLPDTDALGIKMGESLVKALRDHDVFIPCTITGYSELDTTQLSVTWTITNKAATNQIVYKFLSQSHQPTRPGSYIPTSELITGNAGLHLPRVQFTDEGEYTCTVFYTPDKDEGQSALQVSVQPTGIVAPTDVVVQTGSEKSVMCEANGFYPKDITIQWVKYLNDSNCVPLNKGTCTTDPIGNKDGTFNISSHLTVTPRLDEDGDEYSCIISHRSLKKEQKLNFTLTVKEQDDKTSQVIGAVVATVVVTFIVVLAASGYVTFIKKQPPRLSPITGAEHLVHMNKGTLSCQISGYRPEPIKIVLCLKRKGAELEAICSWESEPQTDQSSKREEQSVAINFDETQHLVSYGDSHLPPAQRPLRVEMFSLIKTNKKRISNCQCTIHITPNLEEDDGAELSVWVTHRALSVPSSVSCPLKVEGVRPKLFTIVFPLRIIHGESLTLTCPINGFKPKPLSVIWIRLDLEGLETEIVSWEDGKSNIKYSRYSHCLKENIHEDYSSSFLSQLTVKPTVKEDHGVKYICRTFHYATNTGAEERMEMCVLAVPELHQIKTFPEIPCVGEEIKFSCKIHSFHPQKLEVSWYKGNEVLSTENSTTAANDNGLLSFTSRITYSPCVRDIGKKFRCEVSHLSLQNPKCVSWELKHLIHKPSVGPMECNPEILEHNQLATLSCIIKDFYPKDLSIQWYKGPEAVSCDNYTEVLQEDQTSGLFSKTTEMSFIPSINDHGTEFQLEVTAGAQVVKRTICIELKGLPQVKDIICSNLSPKYGKPLTLSCEVSGCNVRDITAEWQMGNNPITTRMRAETQTNGNSVSFLLTLTPTAEHYGKLFTCLIKHNDLKQPMKKNISLRLPDVPPTLSDITVSPKRPEANREAIFHVSISGFSAKGLQVKWLKSFIPLTANITTTEPHIGKDELYSCTSTLKYTLTDTDHNKFIRCEVTANREIKGKQFQLDLRGDETEGKQPLNAPEDNKVPLQKTVEVKEIECVTPNPRKGEVVTLQCMIKGQDVKHGDFSWSDGIFPIDESLIDNSSLTDGSGCISKVTFTPEHGKIRFETTFNFVTTERTYQLQLA
ncbi:uncharacterized protein LOC108714948 [Xenopus laevis]|uniref:Uncharacterized protein LOC108714948 n=2 Tax=Xenopus laevis TaxID=8355 RepID=A0A1L8GE30_XENLA|nr:uncharacterized protein LOC108714948 [Xenopus laevis]OCT82138.1 hypothetical protein XELAEV_18024650mg [Xenopus laevis]